MITIPYLRQMLEETAGKIKMHIRIDLRGSANYKRELAVAFENAFDQTNEESAEKIKLMMFDSVKSKMVEKV